MSDSSVASEREELLQRARTEYRERDWVVARDLFSAASETGDLDADDRYALANCAWWLGLTSEALPGLQEAYHRFLDEGRHRQAALAAFDAGYTYSLRGEEALASGWMGRAVRLLEAEPECAERTFLVYLAFEEAVYGGEPDRALALAQEIHAAGERFGDVNLLALGVLGEGRALIHQGKVAEGMARLDEAMVAAVDDDLDPGWAGNIYCHVMQACYELADWRRSVEWTTAVAQWCEQMPGAGPFLGICRVHRAQTLQVLGSWDEAEQEVTRVCTEFRDFNLQIVAEAHYNLGDLRRLRGDFVGAEEAYTQAHTLGRDPQPGLAELRLVQGRAAAARQGIRSALEAAPDPLARAKLLPALAEICLTVGDGDLGRRAVEELDEVAARYGTTGLQALALDARGRLLLHDGDAAEAVQHLRRAVDGWRSLRAPYQLARSRFRLADAYAELGDAETSDLERSAAQAELTRLGAVMPGPPRRPGRAHGLTAREAEVLALVAAGRSNQEIADELVLSVRTVERHLATVYEKLGLQGRNARAAAVSMVLREGAST